MKTNGVAFAAGGAKGFAHIPVLKLLEENNFKIEVVTGSSAGAIVAALYALHGSWEKVYSEFAEAVDDQLPMMKKYLKKVEGPNLWSILNRSLVSTDEYYPFFKKLFGKRTFSDCNIKLGIVVYDILSFESILVTEGFLVETVMASSSVPAVFKPVQLAGTEVVDGGVTCPVPSIEARKLGADFVISSDFVKEKSNQPKDQLELLYFLDRWKEKYIIDEERSKSDLVISHPVKYQWYEFENYEKIYLEALEHINRRRNNIENFIRR
ncbi:MAG: patatin-like phospholipase family protein [Kosmotogaceae bacterium]